ncbi:MAG: DUF4384 domain-containing protein [Bacteroidales bacterium]|nr:DUF4384 domain-containing protein [Bacteroidales bacterium]
MHIRRLILTIIAMFVAMGLSAQKMKTASGSYTYYAPENVTLEQAKRTALERAMNQIIADNFGTDVQSTNLTRIENSSSGSSVDMVSLSATDVKGEWVETLREPEYDISWEQGMLVVTVSVTGRIRERENDRAPVQFEARLLRNGTEDNAESLEFKDGDDLFLSFRSPIGGYLAVYLYDGQDTVLRLLPYAANPDQNTMKVKARERNVFFSPDSRYLPSGLDPYYVTELVMTCSKDVEFNRVYVIFSPTYFTVPIDEGGEIPFLSYHEFQVWLAKTISRVEGFQVDMKDITIRK